MPQNISQAAVTSALPSYTRTSNEHNYAQELTLYFYTEILPYVIVEKNIVPGQEYNDSDEEPTYNQHNIISDSDSDKDSQNIDGLQAEASIASSIPQQKKSLIRPSSNLRILMDGLASKSAILTNDPESTNKISDSIKEYQDESYNEDQGSLQEENEPEESELPQWIVKTNMEKEHVEIKFISGVIYRGELYRNMFEGRGIYQWPNGTYYEGQFQKGCITGYGKLTFSNQSYYSGELTNCIPEGMGVFSLAGSPLQYSGQWRCGLPNGNGHLHYDEHDFYEGEWSHGKRNGPGLRVYSSGSAYSGNWIDGKQNGFGSMAFYNRDFYKGEWKDGMPHGHGEYTWNTRLTQGFTFTMEKQYKGNFAQGKRDGYGVQIFGMEGSKIVSLFEGDMKHGPGILVCGDGTTIERKPMFISDCPARKRYNSIADSKSLTYDSGNYKSHGRISSGMRRSAMNILLRETFPDGDYERMSKIKQTFPSVDTNCIPVAIPMHATPKEVNITYHVKKLLTEMGKPNIFVTQGEQGDTMKISMKKDEFPNAKDSKSEMLDYSAADLPPPVAQTVNNFLTTSSDDLISTMQNAIEDVNVSDKVNASVDIKESILTNDKVPSYTVIRKSSSMESFQRENSDSKFQENLNNESRLLSRSIANNYVYLRALYQKYATLNPLQACCPEFDKPVMSRLHMWQFLRDIDVYKFGMSLSDIDHDLLDIPNIHLDTEHDPFEVIYFWQFIHLLLYLAYRIFLTLDFIELSKDYGTYQALFNKLLEEVIKPNEERFIGKALFDCKNVLPLKAVHALYKSVGEPHSARKLLSRICNKQGQEPLSCFFKKTKIYSTDAPHEHFVLNGSTILYLWVKNKNIWEVDDTKCLNKYASDPFYADLRKFRVLGPKKVMKCIDLACPNVKKEGNVVFIDYQIVFLEFYEILINLGNELKIYYETLEKMPETVTPEEPVNVPKVSLVPPTLGKSFNKRKSTSKINY